MCFSGCILFQDSLSFPYHKIVGLFSSETALKQIYTQINTDGISALNRGSMRTQVFLEPETGKCLCLVLNWATCLQFRQKPGFFTTLYSLMWCYHADIHRFLSQLDTIRDHLCPSVAPSRPIKQSLSYFGGGGGRYFFTTHYTGRTIG